MTFRPCTSRSLETVALLLATASIALAQDAAPSVRIAGLAGDRPAAICYTFDDGLRDQLTLAVPMLNEVGFKGTFFIIAGKVAETQEAAEQKDRNPNVHQQWGGITWTELKQMSDQGHEIGSHTWSHPNLPRLTPDEVDAELGRSYDEIKKRIGEAPLTIAFPYNASTLGIQAAIAQYYVAYRAFQLGTGGKSTVASLNAWADQLVADRKCGILMTHGISHGYAALSDPEILRAHFKYVKSREKDIWVDTFANVSRYLKERDDAKLKITGGAGSITCIVSSSLDPQLYYVPLTLVVDAPGAASANAERAGRPLPARVANGSVYVDASPAPQPITITWK